MLFRKKSINFAEFFLALAYSLNLKIITAQDTTENINKTKIVNFPMGVALSISERKFPLCWIEPGNAVNSMLFI